MKQEKGFTLIEVIIGLAITGLLATIVAAAIPTVMTWAPRQAIKLGVEEDLSFARYWLTRDANAAETFVSLSAPQYGQLRWSDFSGASMVSYNVTYSYNSATASLIREEWQNNVLMTSLPVARKILSQSDAQFTWSPGTRRFTANVTATIEDAPGVGDHSRSASVVTTLRPAAESTVSPPSNVPIPPPPRGSEYYYIYAEPTLLQGTYVSGNYTSLRNADGQYYVVEGVIIGGTKYVTWWGESEAMFSTSNITPLEIRFTGQVSNTQHGVSLEFFVKDSAAGFPAIAQSGFTITQANTPYTHVFYLDATALAYINSLSPRRVTLKVAAADAPMYTLSTEQVLFIATPAEVAPPPVTYYVYAAPTITYGTLVSGNYTSLHDVDTSYYVVNSATVGSNKIVSWWGESENMSAPATISQIEVSFTGKSSRNSVTLNFYVKDSGAGFPATPSSSFTFTAANTDYTHSFNLNATALAYVNSLSPRRVTLKVEINTSGSSYTLSTDQIKFTASP